jgi:hypothetical protein
MPPPTAASLADAAACQADVAHRSLEADVADLDFFRAFVGARLLCQRHSSQPLHWV